MTKRFFSPRSLCLGAVPAAFHVVRTVDALPCLDARRDEETNRFHMQRSHRSTVPQQPASKRAPDHQESTRHRRPQGAQSEHHHITITRPRARARSRQRRAAPNQRQKDQAPMGLARDEELKRSILIPLGLLQRLFALGRVEAHVNKLHTGRDKYATRRRKSARARERRAHAPKHTCRHGQTGGARKRTFLTLSSVLLVA